MGNFVSNENAENSENAENEVIGGKKKTQSRRKKGKSLKNKKKMKSLNYDNFIEGTYS